MVGTAIWWIRRDLRLADNQALMSALQNEGEVLPVFVLDPALVSSPWSGENRLAFLLASLQALDASLQERGARLVFLRGRPEAVLPGLVQRAGASTVYAEQDHSPYSRQRDDQLGKMLPLKLLPGVMVHAPGEVLKPNGSPYTVFTPYSRAWRSLPIPGEPLPAPERIPMPEGIAGEPFPVEPDYKQEGLFPAGEAEARRRLDHFIRNAVGDYQGSRNRLDLDGTSLLSPYLRFGMLSARQAVLEARRAQARLAGSGAENGPETWLNELIWREFYISILHHFPHVRRTAFREGLSRIPWVNNPSDFDAWRSGQTGYPVVDAAMRQLQATGWMHNRARMIAASFLAKDLLIDWRWGERWFMQTLLDGDPAANNGGWQWTAGTGTDAAPDFRIFNPVLQGIRFDPDGNYVRRHVPELASLPAGFIHQPWKLTPGQQAEFGCILGKHYPNPVIEHAFARERTLAAYRQGKDGA